MSLWTSSGNVISLYMEPSDQQSDVTGSNLSDSAYDSSNGSPLFTVLC